MSHDQAALQPSEAQRLDAAREHYAPTAPQHEHYFKQSDMPADAVALMEDYAFRFGRCYDSYLVTEGDREYFWSRSRGGFIAYIRYGYYLHKAGQFVHVIGGLMAPDEHKPQLLREFLEFANSRRFILFFYSINADDLPLFDKFGFQISKWGEEPIIDLEQATWKGKSFSWVRRQENYCRRKGMTLRELDIDVTARPDKEEIFSQLRAISRQHVARTLHGKELKFAEGRFNLDNLGRKRLFLAERNRQVEAFLICNPCLAGDMWAIEMYRRRDDALRGVIPFMMLETMRQLKEEGVARVSLSTIPGLRTRNGERYDSKLVRVGFTFWWRYFNWLFDMRGIYHFKSRFRPEFRPLYVAALPRMSISAGISFMLLWGVLRVPPRRLLRALGDRFAVRRARASMAHPSKNQPSDC